MKTRFEQRYLMAMIFVVIYCLSFSVSFCPNADESQGNAPKSG